MGKARGYDCRAPKREANKRRTGEVLFHLGVRTYICLYITLGKDRHIHTVTLGKDRLSHSHTHLCMRAWPMDTACTATGIEWQETALES